jgi:hypothetical protein
MLRGSLITLKRKCGKPTCHCAKGKPHRSPALSYNLQGKTKIITLRPADVPEVKDALRRYTQALQSLRQQALQGIQQLSARLRNAKEGRGHEG